MERSNPPNIFYHSIILYKSPLTFVDYKLYACGKKRVNEIMQKKVKQCLQWRLRPLTAICDLKKIHFSLKLCVSDLKLVCEKMQ